MSTTYVSEPDNGNLFIVKNKVHPKAPDLRGNIVLSVPLLTELVNELKAGGEAKIEIALWRKHSPNVGEFFSAKISQAWKKPDDPKPSPKKESDDDIPF